MTDELDRILELKQAESRGAPGGDAARLTPAARAFLNAFIAFLALSALVSIVAILGGKFGEFEIKVVLSTITIAIASLCGLSCAAYGRKTGHHELSVSGVALALLSAGLIIGGMWTGADAGAYWKTTVVLSVLSVACAHFFGLALASLRPSHQWVLVMAGVAIFALAGIISVQILAESWAEEGVLKLMAVVSILIAMATLTIPILHRMDRAPAEGKGEKITVTRSTDGTYRADDGRVFVLRESAEDRHEPRGAEETA